MHEDLERHLQQTFEDEMKRLTVGGSSSHRGEEIEPDEKMTRRLNLLQRLPADTLMQMAQVIAAAEAESKAESEAESKADTKKG